MDLKLSTEGQASAHGYENFPGQHGTDVELAHVDVNVYDTLQQRDRDEHAYGVASKVQASSEVTLSRRSAIILVVSGVILSAVISIISGVVVYHVTNGKTTQADPETVHQRHNTSSHDNTLNSVGRLEEINAILQTVQTTIYAVQEKLNASDKQLSTLHSAILTTQENQSTSDSQLTALNSAILTTQENQNTSDVSANEYRANNDRQLEAINSALQTVQENQNTSGVLANEYRASNDRQLEAINSALQTVQENQNTSDVLANAYRASNDRQLEAINSALQTVQENQNTSGVLANEYRASNDRQLEAINSALQTVQENQNTSDVLANAYRASNDRQLEAINSALQTVQENQNTSGVLANEYRASNDRQLEAINNLVQEIQGKQNSSEKKVGFSVYWPNRALTSDGTPTFVLTIFNTGSYSSTTGKFTCPVAGLYSFSFTLRVVSTTSDVHCRYRINGAYKSWVWSSNDPNGSASGTMIADLSVGDVVDLWCYGWEHVARGPDTKFSGVLITAA